MALALANFVKYEAKNLEQQADLEKRIKLLNEHIAFERYVCPAIDDQTGKAVEQFLVRWRNESVQIFPVGDKLPKYRLSHRGKDNVERMLNVHDLNDCVRILLRTSYQEDYNHYYLFRNPEVYYPENNNTE